MDTYKWKTTASAGHQCLDICKNDYYKNITASLNITKWWSMVFYRDVQVKLTLQRLTITKCLETNMEHLLTVDIYTAVSKKNTAMPLLGHA
jgi:hypothetical protein